MQLALEIAREGREGRRIETLFTVGKADEVLAASRALLAIVVSERGVVRVFHGGQIVATENSGRVHVLTLHCPEPARNGHR